MKIHCAQLVEEALQEALAPEKKAPSSQTSTALASTLVDQLQPPQGKIKIRVIPKH
jgi:hypothetical protein